MPDNSWTAFQKRCRALCVQFRNRKHRSGVYQRYLKDGDACFEKLPRREHAPPPPSAAPERPPSRRLSLYKFRSSMDKATFYEAVCRYVPALRLNLEIHELLAAGSYGVVLKGASLDGRRQPVVIKLSRIAEGKGDIIKLPEINGLNTRWHTVTLREYKRGVGSQKYLRKTQKFLYVPKVLHHGCTRSDRPDEVFGINVMEFVEGATLRKLLNSEEVPSAEKEGLVRQCAKAIRSVHGLGVVHGDYHSHNLLVESERSFTRRSAYPLVLIDFDRCVQTDSRKYRKHDALMLLDTIPMDLWPVFCHAYYDSHKLPVRLEAPENDRVARKAELHAKCRELFGHFIEALKDL